MPRGPSSKAKSRTMLSSAALAAPSTPWPGKLRIESMPEIIRTRPPSRITLFASWTAATKPLTLNAKVRARLCGLVSSSGLNAVAAAFAIRMSRPPSSEAARVTIARTCASSSRSALIRIERGAIARTSSSVFAALAAPRRARLSAIARPSPRVPPVTIAILLVRSCSCILTSRPIHFI